MDWSKGLQRCGTYYEGWVDDLDELLSSHSRATVTSYGTRRSSKSRSGNTLLVNKENISTDTQNKNSIPKLFWANGRMELDNTPFCIAESRQLDCQFGPHYYKDKSHKSSRVLIQGSRKKGCHAHISIRKCIAYPEYKVELQGKATIRTLRERKMFELKAALSTQKCVATRIVYFVSLPTEEAHTGHHTGNGVAGFSQRMNKKVAAKISELVAEGITEIHEVRRLLRHYVTHDLCKESPPNPDDRAYFPIDSDLKNHIYMAKRALQLSCLDQENLHLKINEWKISDPESLHFFRPYLIKDAKDVISPTPTEEPTETTVEGHFNGNDGGNGIGIITDTNNYEQTLLWIHQSKWQQELLARYGNTISLIDATYKTTKYDLALFFICVKTNVGYSVVAEFVIQSETAESISEALAKLKVWNPNWCPLYFMSDYSEAELVALEEVFPATTVYLCDFHREQAWDRWAKDHKHGLSQTEAEELLTFLRACAWAPPTDEADPTSAYKLAVTNLKQSAVWNNHEQVREWLTAKWLTIPQRWARAYRDDNYHAAVDTNNGTEAQNRLFKYSFLPRRKQKATLSSTVSIIVENFLPTRRQQYVLQNFQQSSMYRSYHSHIPSYLHDRPRSVIIHCLDRRTNSSKFLADSIHDIDSEKGVFEVEKTSGSKHRVDFGISSSQQMPSCTCKDWLRYHIPCKHFFAIFTHRSAWSWNNLPQTYLQSAYLSTDTQALQDYFQSSTDNLEELSVIDTENHPTAESGTSVTNLPKPVRSVSLKTAGEQARITLKCLESLTYLCTDVTKLVDLDTELKCSLQTFRAGLPQEEQLVVRPSVISRALNTKRKYARMKLNLSCSRLPKQKPRGRKKADSKIRNRVGAKADRLRKELKDKHSAEQPTVSKLHVQQSSRVPKVVNNGTKPINYTTIATVPVVGTRKRGRCGDCQGCTEQHDCGTCINCKDKPKFGGPGRKKQCCIKRKCIQLAKRAKTDGTATLQSTPTSSLSTLTKMSARTFAGGLIHGTILAPPGVNIPAVPLSVLQAMEQTDTWPPNFSDFLC